MFRSLMYPKHKINISVRGRPQLRLDSTGNKYRGRIVECSRRVVYWSISGNMAITLHLMQQPTPTDNKMAPYIGCRADEGEPIPHADMLFF